METPPNEPEKVIPNRPKLRNIEDVLVLLESEKEPDGEKINWKDLYEKVGSWETGLELSDKIREVVRNYLALKIPDLKERVSSVSELKDEELLDALSNSWFEPIEEEVKGKRVEVLLSVATHIVRRIEKRIYSKIIEEANKEQLAKLGLEPELKQVAGNILEASAKSDPLYIRYLAYAQLTPQPAKSSNPVAPLGQDRKRHTWAELFPHETQFITKKLEAIINSKKMWESIQGAEEFAQYLSLLNDFFSETDPKKANKMADKLGKEYANSLKGGFPIVISPPTGSYYKEPYLDPELRVSLRTPDAKAQEQHFVGLQQAMADELESLNVGQFSEPMRKKPIASVISIGAYGANLTFTAAAETEKDITIFLDEQIRRYDRNLKKFLPLIDISEDAFLNTSEAQIEGISRDDTVEHEISHSVHTLDSNKKSVKRLGRKPETVIAETTAESVSRGLAGELIGKGKIDYTPEQYISSTIAMPLQVIRERDATNEYFKAAVYVLNGMFEQRLIEFDGSKIRVINKDGIFSYLKENARRVIELYEDSEMTENKAGKWVKENCTAGPKLQELIDFIKSQNF